MNWFFWAAVTTGFVVGLLGIPAFIMLMSPSLPISVRGILGRILWTIGSLCYGGVLLIRRKSGRYEVVPFEADTQEAYLDDEWQEIPGRETYISRLGMVDFAISYEKGSELLADLRRSTGFEDEAAKVTVTDGGSETIDVSAKRARELLAGTGGPRLVTTAKRSALKKFGGDGSHSSTALLIGMLVSLMLGAGMGYVVMGL